MLAVPVLKICVGLVSVAVGNVVSAVVVVVMGSSNMDLKDGLNGCFLSPNWAVVVSAAGRSAPPLLMGIAVTVA